MTLAQLRLKKGENKRIRAGHPWIFSNEIDTAITPLKAFTSGQEVSVQAHDLSLLGSAYINPHSLIAARLYSNKPHTVMDEDFFSSRFQEALQLRDRLFNQPYYRLIFSEGDYVPGLIADRFNDTLVLQLNTAGIDRHTNEITSSLLKLLPNTQAIVLRNDTLARQQEGLSSSIETAFGQAADEINLIENNVQFCVPLLKGQKTGWFYDHRMNRLRLTSYVNNARVLDVFSYLGGWGIQAAMFGAKQIDCIDASEFACQYIAKNAAINQVSKQVKVINDDAFDALKSLYQSKQRYDVIILDPPAFVKKSKDKQQGTIAYQRLNELALKLLMPGGILISCSCSMHISLSDLISIIQRAAVRTKSDLQLIERGHQGPDHPLHPCIPETDYLKAIFVRKR